MVAGSESFGFGFVFCRTWSATEARSLRVSLNSFMDLLLLVIQTVEQFGPPLPT